MGRKSCNVVARGGLPHLSRSSQRCMQRYKKGVMKVARLTSASLATALRGGRLPVPLAQRCAIEGFSRSKGRPHMRRSPAAVIAALLLLVPGVAHAQPADRHTTADRYTNPVSASFADTFADPMVTPGGDGFWYAYGTSDPLREGERTPHRIPTARSADLVHWTYVGDAFGAEQLPAYARPTAALWAPDVRRLGDHWLMYVTVTETVRDGASAIGVATAPGPTGPWTFAAEPAVPPRAAPGGGWWWTFDPAQLTTPDGR